MQGFRNHYVWIIIGFILLLVIGLVFWLKPQSANGSMSNQDNSRQNISTQAPLTPPPSGSSFATSALTSPSQADTQINCQLKLANNSLIVNEQTRDCFEYFITQYGEKSIAQIDSDFKKYLEQNYHEPALSQIQDLWSRYLKYRQQLGELSPPNLKQDDPAYYRAIFSNMKNLRQQFFSVNEILGLFGSEDTYHEYTLNRMAILDDKNLSESEKAKRLKALFDQLPQDWQENLQQTTKLEELRHLTQAIQDRHGSASELRQMRLNLVGAEATQRLETLDQNRDVWKSRVNQYLNNRDTILNSGMSDAAKQQAIDQLRLQTFSNPQEQLRLQTFESVHDQGGTLPFAQ
ncbi:lipase secretion chaperone [Acinetobacter ursingii]|uniref:Lipase chaperone n=1 Tax=Acinetobacter ursingii TaxID=108980 RepID=A0A3D2SJS4_9GAMM|nr:lipase secretion chaperone [Acinetobacter ursingii]MCH2005991.1 lipase secretion chaperone [Acinetobacter ursingii]MCU4305975.1 lipase secretion chaperone [Acinetobacter ursingii]MCU4372130.1 lipase secretion chaperone [Acinetobacter ursingii]MCU4381284.1 lipase secretion chaperone [Acinetobacter ursingii]MCU4609425.1 lipase secretion chaperone [Acinetobacter ursingii]